MLRWTKLGCARAGSPKIPSKNFKTFGCVRKRCSSSSVQRFRKTFMYGSSGSLQAAAWLAIPSSMGLPSSSQPPSAALSRRRLRTRMIVSFGSNWRMNKYPSRSKRSLNAGPSSQMDVESRNSAIFCIPSPTQIHH